MNKQPIHSCIAGAAVAGVLLTASTVTAHAKEFDLSGTSVTIGTAQAQVLNVGTLRMIKMLEGWGADVTRVELPSISGLEAIVADRIDVAARSSDEILSGQSKGVNVVAIGAPISTMHYAVISAPGVIRLPISKERRLPRAGLVALTECCSATCSSARVWNLRLMYR
ncbi:MAG: hypothetical protein AB8B64_26635 [Granulosicoccus sp.]